MMRSRYGLTAMTVVAFVVLLGGAFVAQQRLTTTAFDRLEARQVAEHAERVRVALEYERQLIEKFGATNSVWDVSREAVNNSDNEALQSAFVPADVIETFSIDGILAVGNDGGYRAGGIATLEDAFEAPGSELQSPKLLRTMFDPTAEAGEGICGIARAGALVLFCGFASWSRSARSRSATTRSPCSSTYPPSIPDRPSPSKYCATGPSRSRPTRPCVSSSCS